MADEVEIFSVELDARFQEFEKQMVRAANKTDANLNRIEKKMQITNNRLRKGLEFRGFDTGSAAAFRNVEQRIGGLKNLLMNGTALLGVSLGAGELIKGLKEDEEAARRLSAVLKSTGYAAALSQQDIAKWADELERRTGRGAAEIQTVAAQLATFTSIGRTEFLKAIEVADDLAATFGGDLQSNLDAVARALDDPIKGFGNLQKRGFALNDSELARVKAHLKAGEAAKAQGIILDNLANQVRGAAEATNQGLTKALNELRKQAGDTFKEFADQHGTSAAIKAMEVAAGSAEWLGENLDLVLNAASVLATFMVGRYAVGLGISTAATLAKASAAMTAKGAIEALSVAMAKNPATMIALGVAALTAGILEMDRRMRDAHEAAADLRNANTALKASTEAYAEAARAAAMASGEEARVSRETAAAKREEAIANRDAAKAKLDDARATLAQINAKAAQQNEFERLNIRGDRPGSFGSGSRLTGDERTQYRIADEDARKQSEAISAAQAMIDEADAILKSGGSSGVEYSEKTKSDNSAEKAKARKRLLEDMAAQTKLTVAQLSEQVALVRELERQAEITARIRSLEDAGVSAAEAQTVSAEIQTKLDDARLKALEREEDILVRNHELDVARLDESWATVRAVEEEVEKRALVAALAKVSTDQTSAEAKAASMLLTIQSARAEAASRALAVTHEEHRLQVAQLSGNRELVKVLQDQAAIRERVSRYQQEGRLSKEDATKRASAEVSLERRAADYGEQRDLFASAFSEGIRAAWTGDLEGFLTNQFGSLADTALKRLGEQVFDSMFGGVSAATEGATQGVAMGASASPAIVAAGATAAASMGAAITAAGAAAGATMAASIASAQAANAALSFLPGFSEGGFTGAGTVHQPKGIVHAGEVVWSQRDVARAGGASVVDAMRRGMMGYADGGIVGRRSSVDQVNAAMARLAGGRSQAAPAVLRVQVDAGPMFIPTVEAVAGNVSVQTAAAGFSMAQHESKQAARRQRQSFY